MSKRITKLYISHLLKAVAPPLLAGFALIACTTTTTTSVEPAVNELAAPEPEAVSPPTVPGLVVNSSAPGQSVTPRVRKNAAPPETNRQNTSIQRPELRSENPLRHRKDVSAEPDSSDKAEKASIHASEKDPLTEQYRIDAPEFDPALGEENSENSASSKEPETSDVSENAEAETDKEASEHASASESSASRESSPSSDSAQSASSSSESAQESAPEPETAELLSARADKKETGSSESKELSDEALAKEQIAGGGSPSSEQPTPAEASKEGKPEAQAATKSNAAAELPKSEASAGEEEKPAGAAGGVNVPTDEPVAQVDPTDHSDQAHRYISGRHVEGTEEEPPKKTKSLHWNMQRQIRTPPEN